MGWLLSSRLRLIFDRRRDHSHSIDKVQGHQAPQNNDPHHPTYSGVRLDGVHHGRNPADRLYHSW